MRFIIEISLLSLLFTSPLLGQTKDELSRFEAIDLESELDRELIAFCQGALLNQRGLSCSPFAGNTDRWILNGLLQQQGFLMAIDASKNIAVFSSESLCPDPKPKPVDSKPEDIVTFYQVHNHFSDDLKKRLTEQQVQRLPVIYLYTEGLMALCRPEFTKLFDNKESQERIRKMANEAWTKDAQKLHQSIFVSMDLREAPSVEVELRKISYRLDCQIANILTKSERIKVLDIVSKSDSIRRVTRGAPAY